MENVKQNPIEAICSAQADARNLREYAPGNLVTDLKAGVLPLTAVERLLSAALADWLETTCGITAAEAIPGNRRDVIPNDNTSLLAQLDAMRKELAALKAGQAGVPASVKAAVSGDSPAIDPATLAKFGG